MASGLEAPAWLYSDPLPSRAKGWAPKPNGGVKLRQAWGPPEEQTGAGADAGGFAAPPGAPPTRDDWASGPPVTAVDSPSPAPYDAGTSAPSGDSGSPGVAETEGPSAPGPISHPSAAAVPVAARGGGPPPGVPSPQPASARSRVANVSTDQRSWVNDLTPDALQVSDETGIPWQALLSIPANETGWGKSVGGNNYFGIKGTGPNSFRSPTWEVQNGQRVNTTDSFQGFSSPADSMRGFAQFIQQNPRYQDALAHLKSTPGDWQGFITRIHQDGYATDPDWASKVISIGRGMEAPQTPQGQSPQFQSGSGILDVASTAIGSKYDWGGAGGRSNFDPKFVGSDCSGFVSWAYYNSTGIKLPAQTQSIYAASHPVSQDQAKPGDLVMFNMGQGAHMEHVAIYAGNGMMLHDSSLNPDGGVELTPMWQGGEFRRVAGVDPDTFMNHPGMPAQQPQQPPRQPADAEWGQWSFGTNGVVEPADPSVGTGADVGAGDDWYNDPSINTPDPSPVPPDPAGDTGGGFLDEIGKAKDAVGNAVGGAVSGIAQTASDVVSGVQQELSTAKAGSLDPIPTYPGQPVVQELSTAKAGSLDPVPDYPGQPIAQELSTAKAGSLDPVGPEHYLEQQAKQAEGIAESNPLKDVPVVGGVTTFAAQAATDPLSYLPVGLAAGPAKSIAAKIAPSAGTALTRAASAVAKSAVGRVPGVAGATEQVARAPAQATGQFALDVAGGTLGATQAAQHIDPNDPERIPKILGAGATAAAATHTGVHFLTESGTLPYLVDQWNKVFTPVDLLTDDEKALVVNLANKENSAKVQSNLMRDRIKDTLGKDDNRQWAMGHEEFGGANPLITNPAQAQLATDMIDFTNKTGDVGRLEGFITGDVRGPAPGSPAVHFPHVYEDGMAQARQTASRGGYSPMDTYSHQRTHTLLQDAMVAGLTPVNSVSDPYAMYVRRVLSSQGKMEFVQSAKRLPNSKNLMHVTTAGAVPPDKAALGWVSGKTWSPRMQNIAVSPDMARVLNNMYAPSKLRNAPLLGGGLQGLGEVKQILLGASGFHGSNLIRQFISSNLHNGGDAALSSIMWHGATPAGFRNWAAHNTADIVEAADWGVTLMQRGQAEGGVAGTVKGTAIRGAAGGAFGFSAGYNANKDDPTKNAFEEGLKTGGLGALGAASTRIISDAVFQRYLPMMKVTTFQLMKHAAGPEAAAEYVNDAFGGQNLAAMGRSKTVQDALRVIALAPDWQEGWIKQVGNALKPGALGDLNRQYWSNALVSHAVFLEGMNAALSGHMTNDNGTGHEFDLELTGLYDKMGVAHVDKNTGQSYRVYASILGPYKGMLQPIVEAGQALAGAPGHNAGTVGAAAANMASSRMGILPSEVGALTADTDWKGSPVVPRGTDPWKAAALRIGQSFARLAPIGVQTATQGVDAGPIGAAAAFTGTRVSTMTPVQEEFRQRQQLIDQAGRTPAELETLHQQYSQQLADSDKSTQAVYAGDWKPPGSNGKDATHGQMDQQLSDISKARPKYAEEINSWFPDSLFGGDAAKQRDFTDLVRQQFPGVAGANVTANLPEGVSPDDAYQAFYGTPQDKLQGLTPGQMNSVRGKALAAWSVQNGVDYQDALDAVKAKAWGGATPPKLPEGVTSEMIDSWVTQWSNAPDAQAKRDALDKIAEHYLPGDASGADTVWQRVKLRMMPAQQPGELQVSRDKALDVLFSSRDKGRFPEYMDDNFKPIGNPDQWAQWDQQLTAAGKKRDPNINKLLEQKDRATQIRKNYVLNNVNNGDYERWFGIGKNMSEAQWQKYQSGGYPHYKDTSDAQETLSRDKIEQQWQSLSKAARVNTRVVLQINGQPQPMSLQNAHLHITHTISKGWAKALDIPGSDAVASPGGTDAP